MPTAAESFVILVVVVVVLAAARLLTLGDALGAFITRLLGDESGPAEPPRIDQ